MTSRNANRAGGEVGEEVFVGGVIAVVDDPHPETVSRANVATQLTAQRYPNDIGRQRRWMLVLIMELVLTRTREFIESAVL